MSPELRGTLQRSLEIAKDLQGQIGSLNGTHDADFETLNALVQAHTAHLLNHSAIVALLTQTLGNNVTSSPLPAIIAAGDQMMKDTRQLQEYLIVSLKSQHQSLPNHFASIDAEATLLTPEVKGLQVKKDRGANRPTTPAPAPRNYRSPTAEATADEDDVKVPAQDGAASPTPVERKIKPLKKGKKEDTPITSVKTNGVKDSPKRGRDEDEALAARAIAKRKKRTPVPEISKDERKRKSDVSMTDATEDLRSLSLSPEPNGKRRKQQHEQEQPKVTSQHAIPTPPGQVEYEDITAEVDARVRKTEERREREKKQELGILDKDKRKRQSNDSFNVELGQETNETEKPSRKRKKQRHSGAPD